MDVGKASEVQGVPVPSVQGVPDTSWSSDLVVPERDLGTESGEGVAGDLRDIASQTIKSPTLGKMNKQFEKEPKFSIKFGSFQF